MKNKKWLIVANSTVARVFTVPKKDTLLEIETLVHAESRLYSHDLVSDRPGRDFESSGHSRHAIEPSVDPKQQEFANFARTVAHYIDQGRNNGSFDRLYIVASPNVLGMLRQNLNPSTIKLIEGEADKDITHLKPEEILTHLPFLI